LSVEALSGATGKVCTTTANGYKFPGTLSSTTKTTGGRVDGMVFPETNGRAGVFISPIAAGVAATRFLARTTGWLISGGQRLWFGSLGAIHLRAQAGRR